MAAGQWLIYGVIFPCLLFLSMFSFIGAWRMLREQPEIAKEAGWKRAGWGLYLTGPYGGPYQGPGTDDRTPEGAGEKHRVRRIRLLIALLLAAEVLAIIGGLVIADALDRSPVAGALVGLIGLSLLIGVIWIVVGGRALRSELAQHDQQAP